MATSDLKSQTGSSDGTSQTERRQAALDPGYAPIDERSLPDLLKFARAYAGELRYFDLNDEPAGDWTGFFGRDPDPDEAARYAENPVDFDPQCHYGRPHFALFLSYLRLLRRAQDGLNTITRRHLEFYYETVLRMTRKDAVPDTVNVLLRAAPRSDAVEVPEGSLLGAGKDNLGRNRLYRTNRRILVNHAQVARLSAVYAERRLTGIREAREDKVGTKTDRVELMFRVALGDPQPGGSLPPYGKDGTAVDYAALQGFAGRIAIARTKLHIELFELRDLMKFKRRRDRDDDEWRRINAKLEIAGKEVHGPGFRLQPDDPRDFDANLEKALGAKPDFAGLPEVETIDDVYDLRARDDVREFILTDLHFKRFGDFVEMMQIKDVIDNEWAGINDILELAGQRKRNDPLYRLPPAGTPDFDPTDFDANLQEAIGPVDFDSTFFEEYFAELLELEAYFFMSAENFAYAMAVAAEFVDLPEDKQESEAHRRRWGKVYGILAEAHRKMVFARRRAVLKSVREAASDPAKGLDAAKGFRTLLYFVLGESPPDDEADPLPRLRDAIPSETHFGLLRTVQERLKENPPSPFDWGRVYRVVEIAQRIRERFPEPVARIKDWVNLHAYPDVTSALAAASADTPRWKTFGGSPSAQSAEDAPAENIGWAIGSPVLDLSGGARRIALTLGFSKDGYDEEELEKLFPTATGSGDPGPFRVEVSTEKGWIQPDSVEAKRGAYKELSGSKIETEKPVPALRLVLRFSEQADPLTAPPDDDALATCAYAVVRVMLRQKWDVAKKGYTTAFPAFEHLRLKYLHLKVVVGGAEAGGGPGLSEFLIHNDQTALDSGKPFEPFGSSPAVGSRFYIGHPELVRKRLDRLRFRIQWMGGPRDLDAHYKNYWQYLSHITEKQFKTRIELVDRRAGVALSGAAELFENNNAEGQRTIEVQDVPDALKKTAPTYEYRRSLEPLEGQDPRLWGRYLQWELTPLDFQHQSYPGVAAKAAAATAAALAQDPPGKVEDYVINPPYTPKMKQLGIEYAASIEIDLASDRPETGPDRIFHLHPFGYNDALPDTDGPGLRFFPDYSGAGELYIGIEGAKPPQTLSVLFQMAEGSADPDLERAPVEWSYLSGDRWISLSDGGVRLDTTRGLINTGIIEFELRAAEVSTRLPAGHYWLRGAVARNADAVCDTIAVHAQAASATFVDNDNAPDHFVQPLPEKTITGFSPRLPGIAEVIQPYTSFGGKPQERDEIFYTRVSERLRHKQRALTAWDYERLVLERFPQVYKAKCLPADLSSNPDDAGKVRVVVIPDIRDRLPFDPFEPKAPADLLADIESYLAERTPPYVSATVVNAHYVPVKIRIGVRFTPGYDQGVYLKRLNDDLNRFLSPWAYEEGADIAIGRRIYANSIVNFLDQRDYVDYLAEIKLFSSEDNGRNFFEAERSEVDGYFVSTDKPDGVLVAARRHEIDIIADETYDEELFTGINYMKIELDFRIGPYDESADNE